MRADAFYCLVPPLRARQYYATSPSAVDLEHVESDHRVLVFQTSFSNRHAVNERPVPPDDFVSSSYRAACDLLARVSVASRRVSAARRPGTVGLLLPPRCNAISVRCTPRDYSHTSYHTLRLGPVGRTYYHCFPISFANKIRIISKQHFNTAAIRYKLMQLNARRT